MVKRTKTKKKRLVKRRKVSSQPNVQVNVNVQAQQVPKKERVKRIQSRRRPNLRETRRGMLKVEAVRHHLQILRFTAM